MPVSDALQLLFHGNQLKRTARTGWVQRGISDAENVAAHTYGMAFTALVLTKVINRDLDIERILIMALLHDLPEGITTDIPTTTWRYFPEGIKSDIERRAMDEIVGETPFEVAFMNYWEELHQEETLEAKLVHDADKLDMYLQALVYEQQSGNSQLEEFWINPRRFFFGEVRSIYEELVSLRNKE